MNWKAIKNIYYCILIDGDKIKYLGEDKYRLTSFYPTGEKDWEREYKNGELHGKYMSFLRNGRMAFELKYQNGKMIK